jgi:uncharacterized BrkB/YihY/UPF0761 family membrane protein
MRQPANPPQVDDEMDSQPVGRWHAVRTSVTRRREHLVERRLSSPLIDAGFQVSEHNRVVGAVVLSGAVAFRLFLFLVPFVFVFVVGLGVYAGATSTQDAARRGGVSGLTAEAVSDASTASSGFQLTALVLGIFAMLWTAYGFARVLRTVSALAWRCPVTHHRRPWIGPLVIIGFATGSLAMGRLFDLIRQELGVVGTALTFAAVILIIAAVLLAFVLLPHASGASWPHLLPGAVLAGLGIQALQLATVYYYAAKVSNLSERYGGIGSAIGLLGWAYAVGWLFTFAGVVNAVAFNMTGGRSFLAFLPGGREESVAKNGLVDLDDDRSDQRQPDNEQPL